MMGLTNKQKIYVTALTNDFQQMLLYISGRNQRLPLERTVFMDKNAISFFHQLVIEEKKISLFKIAKSLDQVAEMASYYYQSSIEKLTPQSIKYLAYSGIDRLLAYLTSPLFSNTARDWNILNLFLGISRGDADAWVMSMLPKNLEVETEYAMEFSEPYTATEAYKTSLEETRVMLSQWGLLSSYQVRTHSVDSDVSSLTDEHANEIDEAYRLVAITDEFDEENNVNQVLQSFHTLLKEELDERIKVQTDKNAPFLKSLQNKLEKKIAVEHLIMASNQHIFMHQVSALSATEKRYIEPDIIKNNERKALSHYLHDFFSGNLSYCVIHSDQGHGKSRLIEEAQKNLWGNVSAGKQYIPIAVYLEKINIFYDPSSGQSFFHQYLSYYYHYTDREIELLTQQCFFAIFVTQIDECTNTALLNNLATTHIGHGYNNGKMVFLPNRFSLRLDVNITDHVQLAPFNKKQIQDFLGENQERDDENQALMLSLNEYPELMYLIQKNKNQELALFSFEETKTPHVSPHSPHSSPGFEALPALLNLVCQNSLPLLAIKKLGQPLPVMPHLLYQQIMEQQSDEVKDLVADLMIAYFQKKQFFVERKTPITLKNCPFLSVTLTRHENETPYALVLKEPQSVEEIAENTLYLYLDKTNTYLKYTVRLSPFQVTTVNVSSATDVKKAFKQRKNLSESDQAQIYQIARERNHLNGLYYRYTFSQDSWRDYCMAYFLWFFREEQNESVEKHVWNVYPLAETFPQVLHFVVEMLQHYQNPEAAGLFFYQKFNAHGYQDSWSNAYKNTEILLAEATMGLHPVVFSWRPHSPSFYEDWEDASVQVIQIGNYHLKLTQPFDYRTIPEKILYLYLEDLQDLTAQALMYSVKTPEGVSLVGMLENPAYDNVKKRLKQGFNLTKSQVNSIMQTLNERGHVIYTTTTDLIVHENQIEDILRVRPGRRMRLDAWKAMETQPEVLTTLGHATGISVESPRYLSPYDGTYKGLEDLDDRQSIQSNATDKSITQKLYDALLESIKHPEGWYDVCLMSSLPANEQPEPKRLYLAWVSEKICSYKTEGVDETQSITLDELSDYIGLPRALFFFSALKEKRLADVEDFQEAILKITAKRGHTPPRHLMHWVPDTLGLTQTAGLRRIAERVDERNMQRDLIAYIDWIKEALLRYEFDLLSNYSSHQVMDPMKIYVEMGNDVLFYLTAVTPKKQLLKKSSAIKILGTEKAETLFDVLGGPDILRNKEKAQTYLDDFLSITIPKGYTPVQAGTHCVDGSIITRIKKEDLGMKVYQLQRKLEQFLNQRVTIYRNQCIQDGVWYNQENLLVEEPSDENIQARLDVHQQKLKAAIRRLNQVIHDEILQAREDLGYRLDLERENCTRVHNQCMVEIEISGNQTTHFMAQVNKRFEWLMCAFPKTAQKYQTYSTKEKTAFSESIAAGQFQPLVEAFITTFVQEEKMGFEKDSKEFIKKAQSALFGTWILQQEGNVIGNFWKNLEASAQKIIQDAVALGKISLALVNILDLDEDKILDNATQETIKRDILNCINEGLAQGIDDYMSTTSTSPVWLSYSTDEKQRFIAMIRTLHSQKSPDFSVIADEFPELFKKPSAFYVERYLRLGFSPDAVGQKKEPLLFFALRLFAGESDPIKCTQYFRVIEYLCNAGATINIHHERETLMNFIINQYSEYSKLPGVENSVARQLKLKQWAEICESAHTISHWFERNTEGEKALNVLKNDFSANVKKYEEQRFPSEDAHWFIKVQAYFSNLTRPERITRDRLLSLERVPGELAAFDQLFNLSKQMQIIVKRAENCEKVTSSLGLLSEGKIKPVKNFLRDVKDGMRDPLGEKRLVVPQKSSSFFGTLFLSSPKESGLTKRDAQELGKALREPMEKIHQNEMKKLATENKKLVNQRLVAENKIKVAEDERKVAEDERKVAETRAETAEMKFKIAEDQRKVAEDELEAMKKIFFNEAEQKKSSSEEATPSRAESKASRKSTHSPTLFQSNNQTNTADKSKNQEPSKTDEFDELEKDNYNHG